MSVNYFSVLEPALQNHAHETILMPLLNQGFVWVEGLLLYCLISSVIMTSFILYTIL